MNDKNRVTPKEMAIAVRIAVAIEDKSIAWLCKSAGLSRQRVHFCLNNKFLSDEMADKIAQPFGMTGYELVMVSNKAINLFRAMSSKQDRSVERNV